MYNFTFLILQTSATEDIVSYINAAVYDGATSLSVIYSRIASQSFGSFAMLFSDGFTNWETVPIMFTRFLFGQDNSNVTSIPIPVYTFSASSQVDFAVLKVSW